MQEKKKILIFIDWFLPGYKAGGPVRSMANMVEYLGDKYDFYILTRNTDYTETIPYKNITYNQWVYFQEGVKVFYASEEYQNLSAYRKIIEYENFEAVYINGIYSWKYSILPLIALKKYAIKTIVASRGMLAKSAIDVKGGKKKVFLKLMKLFNLYKKAIFHATNEKERQDIIEAIGTKAKVVIADNLPKSDFPKDKYIEKRRGVLKLVSLARISPEKNTKFALERLADMGQFEGEISFDLYGQIYNQGYWEECKVVIGYLPQNIKVIHKGTVDAEQVGETIQKYHVLFLPSRGENFGHVILESLMAGRPVLISDQTPWKGLEEEKCGWDLALHEHEAWSKELVTIIKMEQEEYQVWCNGARNRAERFVNDPELVESYEGMFDLNA